MRRLCLVLLIVALAACTRGSTDTTVAPTTPPSVTATTDAGSASTASGTVDPAMAEELGAEVDELIGVTEQLRQLEFIEQPEVAIVSKAEMEARIRAEIADELEPEDIAIEDRLWTLLGPLRPSDDLGAIYEDLLAEQVVGFYDGETKELLVAGESDRLSGVSKSTIVHELTHALVDQHFGFHARFTRLVDEKRFDEAAAYQALIEGEATFVQLRYVTERLSPDELLSFALELGNLDTSQLDDAPPFLVEQLEFPYDDGFVFVQDLVDDGGMPALDAAYERPPISTEQIFHPDLYRAAEPPDIVAVPGAIPAGFEVYEESSFGELGIRLLFVSQRGLDAQLGAGWGGDAYRILFDSDDVIFQYAYQGDTQRDARELAVALVGFATTTLGAGEGVDEGDATVFRTDDLYVLVRRSGASVEFVASSDPAAGAAAA